MDVLPILPTTGPDSVGPGSQVIAGHRGFGFARAYDRHLVQETDETDPMTDGTFGLGQMAPADQPVRRGGESADEQTVNAADAMRTGPLGWAGLGSDMSGAVSGLSNRFTPDQRREFLAMISLAREQDGARLPALLASLAASEPPPTAEQMLSTMRNWLGDHGVSAEDISHRLAQMTKGRHPGREDRQFPVDSPANVLVRALTQERTAEPAAASSLIEGRFEALLAAHREEHPGAALPDDGIARLATPADRRPDLAWVGAKGREDPEVAGIGLSPGGAAASQELGGVATGSAPDQEATPVRVPVMPHSVGQQLAEGVAHLRDKPVEITLSPEELGRVRMTLTRDDAGLVLSLTADRHETLDLMRRHIDQLAQDFRDMGYERLSFSFGQGQSGGERGQMAGNAVLGAGGGLDPDTPPDPVARMDRRRISVPNGLDLRI